MAPASSPMRLCRVSNRAAAELNENAKIKPDNPRTAACETVNRSRRGSGPGGSRRRSGDDASGDRDEEQDAQDDQVRLVGQVRKHQRGFFVIAPWIRAPGAGLPVSTGVAGTAKPRWRTARHVRSLLLLARRADLVRAFPRLLLSEDYDAAHPPRYNVARRSRSRRSPIASRRR